MPDAEQDQGKSSLGPFISAILNVHSGMHEFSWAVLPHVGHFLQSDVPQAAYLFNSPLHCEYLQVGHEYFIC